MKTIILLILQSIKYLFLSKKTLIAENIFLRQQLNIYERQIKKPRLKNIDRFILVWLSKIFSNWKANLRVAKPATLTGWSKKGFKLFWKWKCRKAGRPNINWELIKLIRKMQKENPLWSAQRIQGELKMLDFSVCDNTVAKYMKKPKGTPEQRQRWKSFLHNHSPQIIGIDFLVARTITFKAIYIYIAISHDRRKILHFGVTSNPTSQWATQQLRETLAFDETTKYIIRDNDKIYSDEFKDFITNKLKLEDTHTTPASPWQNPICERVNGTLRRECLNHVIVFNETHLYNILDEYINEYYNVGRTHMSLDKDAPVHRPVQGKGKIVSKPILGGLHHIL